MHRASPPHTQVPKSSVVGGYCDCIFYQYQCFHFFIVFRTCNIYKHLGTTSLYVSRRTRQTAHLSSAHRQTCAILSNVVKCSMITSGDSGSSLGFLVISTQADVSDVSLMFHLDHHLHHFLLAVAVLPAPAVQVCVPLFIHLNLYMLY